MFINYQGLNTSLNKKLYPLYIIIGQDAFIQNDIYTKIKSAWHKQGSIETEVLEVDNNWHNAFDLANSYGLFSELTLLDIRFNKKSVNKDFKEAVSNYLDNYNPKSLVIIKAPQLTNKQLQFLDKNPNAQIVLAKQLSLFELESWIRTELKRLNIQTNKDVASLICQFSQNNMLAAQQTITKLNLINTPDKKFTSDEVLQFINDQSEYPVYDLTSACLQANASQAINILHKFAQNNQTSNIYILWLLSNEVRQILQLKQLLNQSLSIQAACKKLKIWPQKVKMYEKAVQRFSLEQLTSLLSLSAKLDTLIKSTSDTNIWDKIEQLTLLICLGWKTK